MVAYPIIWIFGLPKHMCVDACPLNLISSFSPAILPPDFPLPSGIRYTHTLAYYTSLAVFRDISSRIFPPFWLVWKEKEGEKIIHESFP